MIFMLSAQLDPPHPQMRSSLSMYRSWDTRRTTNLIHAENFASVVPTASRRTIKVSLSLLFFCRRLRKFVEDEKNTRETVDEEGWVHTGDIAEIDSCGRFKIIDRLKVQLFILSEDIDAKNTE